MPHRTQPITAQTVHRSPIHIRAAQLSTCTALAVAVAATCWVTQAQAQTAPAALPGKGIKVQPIKGTVDEEFFQTLIVSRALERLGYDVQPIKDLENGTQHVAVASGDATFTATHWLPLHRAFYDSNGGAQAYYREGTFSRNAVQGYLIDKATATQYGITNITQLRDPKLAALFDSDGDGKADLTGCNPGWGCELAINQHLQGLDLTSHITHRQGNYQALIADTITRYKENKPILYYAWSPYWINTVLRPGQEVVWLEVPNVPGAQGEADTRLANGKNYGFQLNQQYILANKAWAQANPVAARLFALMEVSVDAINAQNMRMRQGENSQADVQRHVDLWIQAHQSTFDGWIAQALASATPKD